MFETTEQRRRIVSSDGAELAALIDAFERAWQEGPPPELAAFLPSGSAERHEALCELAAVDLEYRWKRADALDSVAGSLDDTGGRGPAAGLPTRPRVEDYQREFPELDQADPRLVDLLAWEYRVRRRWGDLPTHAEYVTRFPALGEAISAALAAMDAEFAAERPANIHDEATILPTTRDQAAADEVGDANLLLMPRPAGTPKHFGRYTVMAKLGEGGYGVVYQGFDTELRRDVAIKVPRCERVISQADAEAYLTEARVVASLDHPAIVPVHDVGRTDDGLCYVVSKFMPGGDLAGLIDDRRPSHEDAAELIVRIADALHYAHKRGLVHRDIKPGNILLDEAGHPLVSDFGLALRDEAFGSGSTYCGTPRYMSPEQARGEGHRVDARSDIYSLGIVFYELLTGRSPYRYQMPELLDEITSGETRPPRQLDDKIPKELDRICLKALAKRAADRYPTALDLADDLRHWQTKRRTRRAERRTATPDVVIARAPGTPSASPKTPPDSPLQSTPLAKVVPKGLRSFDAHDADFFLQLLPGPTDRDGLPDSIRFWKTRIEELDADTTFAVGLIYGPSGCGKSSLVKAGLLPRLAEHVLPVYLEATSDDTEARLSKGLRKACPDLSPADLVETLASLRRGRGLAAGQKLLIVLDQFEQWLHAHRDPNATELVRALRHCDGCHIQCIVMVRDDFWLAASRFMDSLEIRLVQGQNSALVDLFDTLHAHKVLALFGRAFGRLPDRGELPTENEQFLDQAVSDLAEDSKVVSVRLSLFAEMVKGKPWTPATLVEIGGIAGVGATFLEETFSASTAPPRHRLHQKGARAVLKTLLPEAGADIKGHRRSATELLAASGYERRPTEFAELLRILDAELRLVTPADEETKKEHEQRSEAAASPASDAYQLTHDYLVPSLRDWLTRKQRETHRGRAEMRLAERSAAWNAKPDTRFLPSWWEWPNILLFTRRKKWTVPERRVMRAATRHHGARLTAAAVLIAIAAFAALEAYRRVEQRRANDFAAAEQARAETFAENVFTARAEGVPYALDNLRPLGHLAVSFLRARLDDAKGDGVRRLHAAYALADNGQAPWEYLMDAVPTAPAAECRNLVAALAHESELALPELARRAASTAGSDQEARYAIVALHLGDPEPAMDALEVRSDPIHRTTLIHGFAAWHGDLELVAKQLAVNDDGAFRSGICAAFGTIAPDTLQLAERDQATKMLLALYTNAPDGGTHSAAGWALRQWQQDLTAIARSSRPNSDRRWFVNRQGMTLIEIAAGKFMMGWEGEPGFGGDGVKPVHEVTLSKPFYLGDREITVEQFQRFMDDAEYPASEKPEGWPGVIWGYCPWPECPVLRESWFAAVLYCNWLSTREGRKPCYERTGVKEKLKNHDDDSEQEYDVWRCDFAGDGYRLPTEAEWEFACRAGTGSTCKYFYGNGTDLLTQYAWFHVNPEYHTWPGGMKLPNAFGLFDMYGNVDEWCWDWISDYTAEAVTDPTGPTGPTGPGSEQNPRKGSRMVRGGAFQSHAYHCFSAHRFSHYPMTHGFYVGFRVLCGR